MPAKPTKLQRWLDLIAYLSTRRLPVPVEDVWANVPAYGSGLEADETEKQSVRRMFERDKEELREMGIPIETVTYSINYGLEQIAAYRLERKDFHLPYLRLVAEAARGQGGARVPAGAFEVTEGEAAAALRGLQELAGVPALPLAPYARSAFRKLAFDMEPEAFGTPAVAYAEDPEAAATRDLVHTLSEAVRQRKQVRFRYHSMTRDVLEERHVRPYGLIFQHGRWYLVGHDVGREALRMFRVGRVIDLRSAKSSPATPDYDVPDDFDLSEYAGRKAWELTGDADAPTTAVVRFRFPRSLWAERNGHGALVRAEEDGAQLRRFEVRRRDPFLRWLLSMAGEARVEEPAELAEQLRALAAEVVTRYGGGGRHE